MKSGKNDSLDQYFLFVILIFLAGGSIIPAIIPSAYISRLIMYLCLLYYLLSQHGGKWAELLMKNHIKKLQISDFICIIMLACLTFIICGYANAISLIWVKNNIFILQREPFLMKMIFLAIMPAFMEELIFRGYTFQRLGDGKIAILISAIMFAFYHMNFNQMIYAFIAGILFALIYHSCGNLLISILIHFLFNFYTVLDVSFENQPILSMIRQLHIGVYQPFLASIMDDSGYIIWSSVIIGAIISAIALIVILFILIYMQKRSGIYRSLRRIGEATYPAIEAGWKPGILFFMAIAICIMISILQEMKL